MAERTAECRRELKRKIAEMWEQLTPQQRASMQHLARLLLWRREIDDEIVAIQEAAEDGHSLSAPTVH